MWARLFSFAMWAIVMASVTFWALRLLWRSPQAPAHTVAVSSTQSLRGDLAKVLGGGPVTATQATAAPSPVATRFKLVGVAAPQGGSDQHGLALIAVDGKAPKAIGVGRTVSDGWVLQSVHRRGAKVASNLGADVVELELPTMAVAARGALPPPSNSIEGGATGTGASSPTVPSQPRAPGPPGAIVPPVVVPGVQLGVTGAPAFNQPGSSPIPGAAPNAPTGAMPSSGPPPIYVPSEERQKAAGTS